MLRAFFQELDVSIARVLLGLVRVYQRLLSPLFGRQCRFHPTCSEYAKQALNQHGSLFGIALTVWRILRCNPFCRCGHDPVPTVVNLPLFLNPLSKSRSQDGPQT
jgi:putative membrane protein insertion efficiency factor